MLNDYEILGLMDTYSAMRREGIQGIPDTFGQFLSGVRPIGNASVEPQVQTDPPTD